MTRVVMIGIDGLDADLLRVYGPSLPHLRRLMLESPFLELTSSFPPETEPAWASLYTGLHPSNHGIMSSGIQTQPDALHGEEILCSRPVIALEEGTFWEQASQAGKRVCVINPQLPYPSPPATRHLTTWYTSLQTLTLQEAERGLELFQHESWDIFYQQFDTLEYIQHAFWRYSDPGDVAYPGRSKHAGRILDFYRLFDTVIGHLQALLETDDVLLVVSAHGHGRRCAYRLSLNEWLRQQELLVAPSRARRLLQWRYLVDWAKYHARVLLAHRLSKYPAWGKHGTHYSTHLIEQAETMAQVVVLANNSPFGGIVLNRDCIERAGKTYEAVRSIIVQRLRQLRVKGRPVMHWIDVRENICQGKYSECYPDICFELQSEFAVSSAVHVPLVTSEPAHFHAQYDFVGEHRMHGVCLLSHLPGNLNIRESIKEPSVMDIASTVLQLVGVPYTASDGQALILSQNAMTTT